MAGSRSVQARARLRERLIAQKDALAAASRSAAGVDAAKDRRRILVEQGERLVTEAESTYLRSVAELVRAMGSPEIAASVLDLKPAVVRKAIACHPAVGGPNSSTSPRSRSSQVSARATVL